MSDHYKFFSHKQCEYYPCHQLDEINCLFCYCPLYILKDCKGHYKMIGKIVADVLYHIKKKTMIILFLVIKML